MLVDKVVIERFTMVRVSVTRVGGKEKGLSTCCIVIPHTKVPDVKRKETTLLT